MASAENATDEHGNLAAGFKTPSLPEEEGAPFFSGGEAGGGEGGGGGGALPFHYVSEVSVNATCPCICTLDIC